jgi:hypothetical protein
MKYVFDTLIMHSQGTLVQGSMLGNELLFQLFWTPRTLEILQFGLLPSRRKQKRGSSWLKEVLEFSHCTGTRIIARNVIPELAQYLTFVGFQRISYNDFAFPH